MPSLPPIPNTPLRDDPNQDAIWKRWLRMLKQSYAGLGTVTGPSSSTDNAVPRFNGTDGIVLQNSGVVIDDSNNVTGVASITVTGLTSGRVALVGTAGLLTDDSGLTFNTTTDILTAVGFAGPLNGTVGATTPNTGAFTTLSSTGNTTLGDASGDNLTIWAGTWDFNSDFVAARTAGTVAAGVVTGPQFNYSFNGDSGGTSNVRPWNIASTASGSNAISLQRALTVVASHAGSATNGQLQPIVTITRLASTGNVTNANAIESAVQIQNTGSVTGTLAAFVVSGPVFSSTGSIATIIGFSANNLGHASLVTTAIGHDAVSMTAAATLTASFRSAQNSGTGVWGFYHTGTANNAFAGNVRIGSTTAPTVALDVTGALTVSAGTGNIGWGTYTPTLTNVANLDASTAYQCQYMRVGNTVTVSGKVDADPTTPAASTQLGISLPVASNIGAVEDCAGTAFASGVAGQGAAILGDAANNRAQMQWVAGDVTNQPMYFTFTYEII